MEGPDSWAEDNFRHLFENECPSVFGREKNRRRCSLAGIVSRLRDDPNLFAVRRAVSGQNARALEEGSVVELPVFLADFAPVALSVTLEELAGRLSRFSERFECTGCGDDLSKRELRLSFGDHRRPPSNLRDAGGCGVLQSGITLYSTSSPRS